MDPKHLLIVRAKEGIIVRDTPRSQSDGGVKLRAEPVGKELYAYNILNVKGVDYAQLVPQNPLKPEWVRVAEADRSVVYVDQYPLDAGNNDGMNDIARAINRLADAVASLATAISKTK